MYVAVGTDREDLCIWIAAVDEAGVVGKIEVAQVVARDEVAFDRCVRLRETFECLADLLLYAQQIGKLIEPAAMLVGSWIAATDEPAAASGTESADRGRSSRIAECKRHSPSEQAGRKQKHRD